MKAYTDLEQSKVLTEILPIECADMYWWHNGQRYYVETKEHNDFQKSDIPCWSLAALMEYLKQRYCVRLEHDGVSWSITCIEHDTGKKYTSVMFDEPTDACWGMVLRLNKGELLNGRAYGKDGRGDS